MSHDLGFFSIKEGVCTKEIRQAYHDSCEGKEVLWPSSNDLSSFINELTSKYPSIDSIPEDLLDDCPWSCEFDQGEGYIIISMVFSRVDELGKYIWELLQKYQLIVFDPQSDKAYIGNNEIPEVVSNKKWWRFW